MLEPTIEQEAILERVGKASQNLQINAYAGTGKTATLSLIEGASKGGPTLCLAFNRSVKLEWEEEEKFTPNATLKTINGLGHSVWGATCAKRAVLNIDKTKDLLRETIKQLPRASRDACWERFYEIKAAVGMGKSLGYVPEGKFPHARRLCDRDTFYRALEEKPTDLEQDIIEGILSTSILTAYDGHIDFDDQIYMPALFGGTFPKFPLVLVDEAQDLSPTNHALLLRMRGSRVISVGDPFQSIYQFRGACQDGMSKLRDAFAMGELPLSVSWRCPSAIVKNVHWRVPQFRWRREGGSVERATNLRFGDVETGSAANLAPSSAFICRNNAPLFALAFKALAAGHSVSVAGTDIGPKLIGIMRRFGEAHLRQSEVYTAIDEWLFKKLEGGSTTASDMAECMRIFAAKGKDLGQAIAWAEDVLKQKGSIRLTTGHKAKGMEWDHVYHLDPHLLGKDEQELNLRYVIQTRARERYVEVDSGSIEW